MVGNCINKTKYIKLKARGACGLIEESFPAQQLYKFVHGISIDVKVELKRESEILSASFQNGFPNWCGVRMRMVMVNGVVIFVADLKFVSAQLPVCERQSVLPAELAVHGHTV